MSEIASTAVVVEHELADACGRKRLPFTDVQWRLAQDKKVPLRDLPGITEHDERTLAAVGVRTVYDLIFCANSRFFRAFGGRNFSARQTSRRINKILSTHAFPRRISRRDYLVRIAGIRRTVKN